MKIIRQILFLMLLATLAFGGEDWRSMPLRTLETEARGGDAEAQLELGRRYDEADDGIDEVDSILAFRWYRKAARQCNAEAQWRIANAYGKGRGVKGDSQEEIKWCWAAAEQGHQKARLHLCHRTKLEISEYSNDLYRRLGIDISEQLLFDWCLEEAGKGSGHACFILGEYYLPEGYRRRRREPDPEEALIWLKKSLEYGCEDVRKAQELMGDAYRYLAAFGQAMAWYQTAITNLHALSRQSGASYKQYEQYEVFEKIGDLYLEGQGVERNEAKALQCYLDAASRGFLGKEVLYRKISRMYREGIGTPKNRKAAKEWEKKAEKAADSAPRW